MRAISYVRHEFHHKPEKRIASLPYFLLDIPFLFVAGVIPPLAVLNAVLESGGSDGGMSPGASWEPVALTEQEYAELVEELLTLDTTDAKKYARFVPRELQEDLTLHKHTTFIHWLRATKEKHGVAPMAGR
jgi:hypothetical protein